MMYDTLIIGSGMAGLSAAIYASRARLSFAVIEKEYMGTGQIAYTERVDNYPGYYGTDGFSLGEKFREHAEVLGTVFIDGEAVGFQRYDKGWKVILADGSYLETRTVIYAAGTYPKILGITGEKEFLGRGVSYCALCDGAFFADKTVAVIGGGDTALEDALYLSNQAEKVYLIHRRSQFRANKALQEKLNACKNVELVLETVPVEIMGTENVTGIKVNQNGTEKVINADGVFVAVGTVPYTEAVKDTVSLDSGGYIIAGEDCKTSAKGFFTAGDVRTKKVRQILTAAADGANAVISVSEYL